MSEITKLYKNAGIEKEVIKGCYEYYAENGGIDIYTVNDCKNKDCNTCKADKSIKEYPPFTTEKQILLLQLLARIESADYFQFFFYEIKQEWVFRLNMLTELSCESAYIYESRNKNFDECIAGLINIIWQDLTPEEKQQVKGILE